MTNPSQSERRWCEACQDHFDEDHYGEGGNHKAGPQYGPVGHDMVLRRLADLIGGEGAVFWPQGEREFEVRRDGKHFGFVEVTEEGEVLWIA